MSSIAKTSISLSKKDLTKSRIPPVGTRSVIFYHKASTGQQTINLFGLTFPSAEMPFTTQASTEELSSARLLTNKKNLELTSSAKGPLIQGLDYIVVDSATMLLIGPYEGIGTEVDEIFVGKISQAPISDLVVASSKSVVRSYTLPVGQNLLNIAHEFKVNEFSSENIGIIKIFVNGVLAQRNTGNSSITLDKDYYEVDSGSGFGSTVYFNVAPVGTSHDIIVDFGVQAITDFNAIGMIESLSGSVKKLADDVAVMAGTTAGDYLNANPSEVERRGFGDMVLDHESEVTALQSDLSVLNSKYNTTQNLSEYTKTKYQIKILPSNISSDTTDISSLRFNNLAIGSTYRLSMQFDTSLPNFAFRTAVLAALNNGNVIAQLRAGSANTGNEVNYGGGTSVIFVATASTVTFNASFTNPGFILGDGTLSKTFAQLEQLPNHEITTQWT